MESTLSSARALAVAVLCALLVTLLLGVAIQHLVVRDVPHLAASPRAAVDDFIRIPQLAPPAPLRSLDDPPPPPPEPRRLPEAEATGPAERQLAAPEPPVLPGARQAPATLSFAPSRAGAGPWIGEPGTGAELSLGLGGGGGGDRAGVGAGTGRLPSLPPVRIHPIYPPLALRRGIEGHVALEFSIGTDGAPFDIDIVESMPENVFDHAVLDAVRQWRFDVEVDSSLATRRWRHLIRFRLNKR